MTKDQKQVIIAFASFIGFKIALYSAIVYAAKVYRENR